MNDQRGRPLPSVYEAVFLTGLFIVLGWFIVPAHWSSIWMDPEFAGWCAPIAQRIAAGQRLYVDGGHSPMSPLSFLVLSWLFGSGATWITESAANYACQALLILTLYFGLSHYLPRPIPFLAALAAVPVYLQLQKVLLYDGLAQLCAGIAIVVVAAEIDSPRRWRLGALVVATALCIFTKQSTGAGLLAGSALGLLLFGGGSVRSRLGRAAIYSTGTLATVAALALACSPWISPPGFLSDVLVHAGEPKGLDQHLAGKLSEFAVEIIEATVPGMLMFAAGLGLGSPRSGDAAHRGAWITVAGVAAAFLGFVLVLPELGLYNGGFLFPRQALVQSVNQSPLLGALPIGLANAGLAVSFLLTGWSLRSGRMKPLAAMVVAAFFAATLHSLSVSSFRWTFDNNPLVMIALALLFGTFGQIGSHRGKAVFAVVVVLVEFACWSSAATQMVAVRAAVLPAPGIRQLARARLRPSAANLVRFVERIRKIASPADSVLMLPEDPNVESWFERPRPRLTSSIIFVDQYWDHFVDEDFRRLEADPPKVIVIGPQGYWRFFFWQWQRGTGTERLIDRITNELIRRRYDHAGAAPISFNDHPETFDVYVRRDSLHSPP